jgi:hypothetical protein
MTDGQRIHICEPPPSHCSSCFQPGDPEKRYVDFSAFFDGPVFSAPTEGGIRPVIDDLILCQDCITSAAELCGLGDVEAEREQVQTLRYDLEATREQLRLALEASASLEQAAEQIGELRELVKPRTRRKTAA